MFDEEKIDFSKLGHVTLDEKSLLKYFPHNPKGVTFSSKTYNPLGKKPRAPNERLELNIREH